MPAKYSRHVALTGPLAEWVAGQVAKGEYASTSDLVRAAIRLLKAQGQGETRASPTILETPSSTAQDRPLA